MRERGECQGRSNAGSPSPQRQQHEQLGGGACMRQHSRVGERAGRLATVTGDRVLETVLELGNRAAASRAAVDRTAGLAASAAVGGAERARAPGCSSRAQRKLSASPGHAPTLLDAQPLGCRAGGPSAGHNTHSGEPGSNTSSGQTRTARPSWSSRCRWCMRCRSRAGPRGWPVS